MKKLQIILSSIALLFVITWSSCNKDEKAVAAPEPDNEVITTVQLKAVNTADATDTPTAKWVKLNPADTSAPDLSHATLNLKKNASYNVQVQFLDESKTPVSDITSEILQRANYHLVCFNVASGLSLTVVPTDHDTNTPSYSIGLADLFTTTSISSGNLEVQLHHQPNIKNGDCAPGSIDADVNFTVHIN